MFVEFIKRQLVVSGDFYTGENKGRKFLLVIFIGTIFQLCANSILEAVGMTNLIAKNTVSGFIWIPFSYLVINLLLKIFDNRLHIKAPLHIKFSIFSNFLFSNKNQKEVFEPIIADWQKEYFEALSKKEIRKARWINVRHTYAFLIAMCQKSPIGDLIEFISKIAK